MLLRRFEFQQTIPVDQEPEFVLEEGWSIVSLEHEVHASHGQTRHILVIWASRPA